MSITRVSEWDGALEGSVIAVARDEEHRFSKGLRPEIRILEGLGVEGDAHAGQNVQHRSRVAQDPSQPNLRQVHLIQAELFEALLKEGFEVQPGDLGENIATRGLDLLALPQNSLLNVGDSVVLRVTGLRNPCSQIEDFRTGLLGAVVHKRADGSLVRKAGIMSVVEAGGSVRPGDRVFVELPAPPFRSLDRV